MIGPLLKQSASSLSKVMSEVSKQKLEIYWLTNSGGSGVFARALQMTKDQTLRLEGNTAF